MYTGELVGKRTELTLSSEELDSRFTTPSNTLDVACPVRMRFTSSYIQRIEVMKSLSPLPIMLPGCSNHGHQ